MSLSLTVKERALAAGFDLAGVAPLAAWRDLEFARHWTEKGYGGEMQYLKNPQRADVRRVMPSARSVICVGLVYNAPEPYSTEVSPSASSGQPTPSSSRRGQGSEVPGPGRRDPERASHGPRAWISRYAWGHDYHEVMHSKLERLRADLQALAPGIETRVAVDTSPIVERAFARLSGIGWMGKNTCLINQPNGSWFFLGIMLSSLELEPDLPAPDRCGSCTRCLDACPTGALVEPYVMDASRCLAYFNIELKGPIPLAFRPALGSNLFGCDICQDVCPWNGRSRSAVRGASALEGNPSSALSDRPGKSAAPRQQVATTHRPEFQPMKIQLPADHQTPLATENGSGTTHPFSLLHPPLEALACLTEEDFRRVFSHSPIKRVKYRGWLRNLCVVMGNSGARRFVPWLEQVSERGDALVREHATWALARLRESGDG